MQISAEQRREAFSTWLRTGRLARFESDAGLELKFNPWHDRETGRFTFAGQGRYFGSRGAVNAEAGQQDGPVAPFSYDPALAPIDSAAKADAWKAEMLSAHGAEPGIREAIEAQYQLYLARLAPFAGGGTERFGGGGASGSWEPPLRGGAHGIAVSGPAPQSGESAAWRRVSRNGYLFEIDIDGRTRRVTGEVTVNPEQARSKQMQLAAGGSDRRETDHGGHYIARRFNGPTDAFNHFAQDANFNRGRYFALEQQWARAKRNGRNVRVKIVPVYEGESQRPAYLNVWFWIDGRQKSLQLPNEPEEQKNVERSD